jgi:antitoxin component YwqK of YwqJK toxin-antitoxin module
MKTLKKITILLIVLSFMSCESKRKKEADEIVLNEMVIEKNGKYYFGDCELHAKKYYTGSNKYYHENGKVKGTFTIEDGIPEGHWEQFNEDGSKKLDLYFEHGKVTKRLVYCSGG